MTTRHVSDPVTDPTGALPASLRDTVAAAFAAALYTEDNVSSTSPGSRNVDKAYRMADQFLAERARLAQR